MDATKHIDRSATLRSIERTTRIATMLYLTFVSADTYPESKLQYNIVDPRYIDKIAIKQLFVQFSIERGIEPMNNQRWFGALYRLFMSPLGFEKLKVRINQSKLWIKSAEAKKFTSSNGCGKFEEFINLGNINLQHISVLLHISAKCNHILGLLSCITNTYVYLFVGYPGVIGAPSDAEY